MSNLDSINARLTSGPTVQESKLKEERVRNISLSEGIKYGGVGFMISAAATALATVKSPSFSKYMSVSAKSSLPIMTGIFLFTLNYELTQYSCSRFPEKWGLSEKNIKEGRILSMPIHHRIMNGMYDHPFAFIVVTGAPFAGYILNEQMKLKHLKFSQRLMQTRVFAQGGIITILLTTMAFREFMERRGRFPDPNDNIHDDNQYDKLNSRYK